MYLYGYLNCKNVTVFQYGSHNIFFFLQESEKWDSTNNRIKAFKKNLNRYKNTKLNTEFQGLKKLGFQNEPDDMQTNFVNGSMFFGNIMLLFCITVLVVTIKSNIICPPPHFLLNPSNLTSAYKLHCGYSNTSNGNNTIELEEEDYPNFSSLYNWIFFLIVPLGLTSLVLAKSKSWLPKIQDADIITHISASYPWFPRTIHSLKAVMAIILYAIFVLYLFPITTSLSSLNGKCASTPVMHICYSIGLLAAMGVILWLDIQTISKIRWLKLAEGSGTPQYPNERFFISLIVSTITFIGLILIILRLVDAFPPHIQDESCVLMLQNVTIWLVTLNGITFMFSGFITIYYAIAWIQSDSKEKDPETGSAPELKSTKGFGKRANKNGHEQTIPELIELIPHGENQ